MSMDKEHRKHHYVPQLYLKQFGHSDGKTKHEKFSVHVFSKKLKKTFDKNVTDICQKKDLYRISDEFIEKNSDEEINGQSLEVGYFAEGVEPNLKIVLDEISKRKRICLKRNLEVFPMYTGDKEIIAKQIVIQYLRHPKVKQDDIEFTDEVMPKMIRLFKEGLSMEYNDSSFKDLDVGYSFDSALLHAKMSYQDDELTEKAAKEMAQRRWFFLYSKENNICTSDNPIVVVQRLENKRPSCMGLNQSGAFTFYALSPDLLLVITDQNVSIGSDCVFGEISEFYLELYQKKLQEQSEILIDYSAQFKYIDR